MGNMGNTGHAMFNGFRKGMVQVSLRQRKELERGELLLQSQNRYYHKKANLPRLGENSFKEHFFPFVLIIMVIVTSSYFSELAICPLLFLVLYKY